MAEEQDNTPKKGGANQDLVKAESMVQLALMIPAGCAIGWVAGSLMNKWLGTHWIYVVGILMGAVAGFIQIYRTAAGYLRSNK